MGLFHRKYRHTSKYWLITKPCRALTRDSGNQGCAKFIGIFILLIILLYIIIRYWAVILAVAIIFIIRSVTNAEFEELLNNSHIAEDSKQLCLDSSIYAKKLEHLQTLRDRFSKNNNNVNYKIGDNYE